MNTYVIQFIDNSKVEIIADWYDYRYHLVAFYAKHEITVSYNVSRIHEIKLKDKQAW